MFLETFEKNSISVVLQYHNVFKLDFKSTTVRRWFEVFLGIIIVGLIFFKKVKGVS